MGKEAKPPPGGWPDLSGVPTEIPELQAIFDEMRPKRPPGHPKTGSEVWDKLRRELKPLGSDYYSIIGNAQNLFQETVQAFDGGAIEGASLICRATVEAAFYLFLTNKPKKHGDIKEDFPLTLDGDVRQVRFWELIRAIEKKGILSKKQLNDARRIQKHGNLIAHLANQHADQIRRFEKEARRVNKEVLSRKGLSQDDRMRIEMKVRNILNFWHTQEEVLDDLVDTASILITLAKRIVFPAETSES